MKAVDLTASVARRRAPVSRSGRCGPRLLLAALVVLLGAAGVASPPWAAEPVASAAVASARAVSERCYIGVSHVIFLDRPATDAELADWEGRFDAGTPHHRLPQTLATSDEWLSVVVTGLYRDALDRDPEPAGLAHWITELRSGTLVHRIGAAIYGSAELYAAAGGTDAGFVAELYERILGRSPDPAGQAYWEERVATSDRGRVAAHFFGSIESRTQRVEALYQQILGRAAEPSGMEFWADRLRHDNDVRLAVQLASSPEMLDRAPTVCTHTARVTEGGDDSDAPEISADGRWVTFASEATDLVPGDTNDRTDVFLHDRTSGTTTRLTDGDDHSFAPVISADGGHVAFASDATDLVAGDANGQQDIFVWTRTTGETVSITHGDGESRDPAISADGRHVAFGSHATDLVAGDDTNGARDIFSWNRTTGAIVRITHADQNSDEPTISGDGRHVAFDSYATDLVAGDTNARTDVFTWDRTTGEVISLSHGDNSSQRPDISADGRHVTFHSFASDLAPGDTNGQADVFTWDRATGDLLRITDGDAEAWHPSISADGDRIAFESDATDLVEGEDAEHTTDVFVWARSTGAITRLTASELGSSTYGYAVSPDISGDGRHVAYAAGVFAQSRATSSPADIFVWTSLA